MPRDDNFVMFKALAYLEFHADRVFQVEDKKHLEHLIHPVFREKKKKQSRPAGIGIGIGNTTGDNYFSPTTHLRLKVRQQNPLAPEPTWGPSDWVRARAGTSVGRRSSRTHTTHLRVRARERDLPFPGLRDARPIVFFRSSFLIWNRWFSWRRRSRLFLGCRPAVPPPKFSFFDITSPESTIWFDWMSTVSQFLRSERERKKKRTWTLNRKGLRVLVKRWWTLPVSFGFWCHSMTLTDI